MFLYELALELDVRSTALLDRAHAMGMNVDTTAELTPEQVEQLRAAYGRGRGRTRPDHTEAHAALESAAGAGGNPMGTGGVVALVAAALVVVVLVGYMVTNSDDSATVSAGNTTSTTDGPTTTTEPCDSNSGIGLGAIGQDPDASEPADGALPPCDVVGGLSGEEIASASTTFAGDPLDLPRDKRRFCVAALSMFEFELKLFEASDTDAIGPIRDVMLSGRDKFKADLASMRETAPPRIDSALGSYAIVYTNLLDAVTPTVDDHSLAAAFLQAARTDLVYYANQINRAVNDNCDKR